ncbi:MAG: hypothetical protein KGY50_02295 [Candidatus Thermoplasmatota archaeon]|nr:hypothetical protein [Candidatus Thermoplasmatota archaeon]
MLVTPTISAGINSHSLRSDNVEPLGAFQIIINSPEETIEPGKIVEIEGIHQKIPGAFDHILPSLWAAQYSELSVEDAPDWLIVRFPERNILTLPDGYKYNFSIELAINEDAPKNTTASVSFSIKTGNFLRTIFPSWFPLCSEFNIDQDVFIQTGDW